MMTRQELEALRDLYPPDTICIPGLIDSHLQALDDLETLQQSSTKWGAEMHRLMDQRDRLAAAVREADHIEGSAWMEDHAQAIEEAKEVGDG